MRNDRERLLDIQDAIDNIKKYAIWGRRVFEEEELIQNWVIRQLQILGEAAAKISDDFQEQYPDVPWHKIIGMRNILVHDYFGIDVNPALERQIKKLLKE